MMRNRICASVACLFLLCGCKEKEENVPLATYTVEVAHPVRGDVSYYRTWVGRLVSITGAEVMPQVNGYVRERLFRNGQGVKKGDVLFRLDARQYCDALERAKHTAEEAAANLEKAKQNAAFYAPLVKNGSVSRQAYTDAQQEEKAAQGAYDSAVAAVALAQTNVDYCTLTAPIDGVMGFTEAEIGDYVSPNGKPMVTVNRLNPIRIYFSISEQDWLNQNGAAGPLSPDKEVAVTLSNGTLYPHAARISGVNNTVSPSTGSLMLQADIPNPDFLLRPGMFVTVRAQTATEKDALLVPQSALLELQGKNLVIAVDGQGKPSVIPVQVGIIQDGMAEIKGAVSPQSLVIVRGTQQGMMAAEGRARLRVETVRQ